MIHLILIFIITLIPARGALVLHLGLDSDFLYKITAISFLFISLIAIFNLIYFRNYTKYKNFVKISFILCFILSYYTLAYVIADGINNLTLLYIAFFAPLSIYFTRLSIKHNIRTLFIIYISTVIGVYYIFYVGLNDISKLDEVQSALRPGDERIDRLGITYRNGGYLGSCHDAANILSIIGIFLFSNIVSNKGENKVLSIICILIGTPALLLTTSASNISVFFFTAFIMMLFSSKNLISFCLLLATITVIFSILFYFANDQLFIFLSKFRYHGDTSDGGMFNALNESSLLSSVFAFILGFAYTLELPIVDTEIGLIKLLVTFGLIPFILLIYFLFLPLIVSIRKGIRTHYFYYSFPLFASVLSLLHYSSLFRITSIGVLILLYSIFLIKYLNLDQYRMISRKWL